MDALLASAGPLPAKKGRSTYNQPRPSGSNTRDRHGSAPHKTIDRGPTKESIDPTHNSILTSTRVPSSFHHSHLPSGSSSEPIRPDRSTSKIKDKKLKARVQRENVTAKRAKAEREDVDEWLNAAVSGGAGGIEVDDEMGERTWRVGQDEIVKEVGVAGGKKKFDLKLEGMGEYMVDYTRNGRHLAIASSKGHVATFDWQAGTLHSEIQLREPVRDIKFLHSESFFAVAQKKYVFVYDQNGVELHKLKSHIDPTHMEYLPYHYLLSTVGHAGHLKYHDTSTGVLLTQIPTHLGSPSSMAQNPHSAIIHLGHSNGTMTLWSPNMTTPHVKLLAHRGPITGIAVDPSESSAGRYVATCGMEGKVKIWDGRMWGKEVKSWSVRNTPTTISYSQRGMLAVGGKSGITTYRDLLSDTSERMPQPYLNLPLPALTASAVKFCPYDDTLAVGHQRGISSLLVPGSGEPNFDSSEADVYESYSRRREREVRGVLEKIRPELITMDTDILGKVAEDKGPETYAEREARSFRQLGRMERLRVDGQLGEGLGGEVGGGDIGEMGSGDGDGDRDGDEGAATAGAVTSGPRDKGKKKMRGKNTAMKRFMKKKKQNVIDPSLLAMKQKLASQKKSEEEKAAKASRPVVTGALARFG